MHHDLAIVRFPRRLELVTDPAQILRLLLCQGNARLNACMDEGIIADLDHVLETIQKIHMGSGYVIEQPIRQFLEIQLIQFRLAEAIAEHRFTPAKAEQKPCRLHIALRSEEHTSELPSLMRISYSFF